ncbi:hypothetical protein R69746_05615 [Paraburkholderia aspalathi]|jgi:hypothetical protein|nr:hypothetical protein [Paraburkholderia aspalathi]MBK3841758.1 hypothetical protein [Paraburkholderia aspalathi]CAE6810946.1 hypothetical protein R69746_05615 [Paraburkholderia aspalathi]
MKLYLALLAAFYVGAAVGVIAGGLNRAAKAHDQAFEHESDAPYPRVGD